MCLVRWVVRPAVHAWSSLRRRSTALTGSIGSAGRAYLARARRGMAAVQSTFAALRTHARRTITGVRALTGGVSRTARAGAPSSAGPVGGDRDRRPSPPADTETASPTEQVPGPPLEGVANVR